MDKKVYNHMLTIAFEVESLDENGHDITNNMIASALMRRISSCLDGSDADLLECTGAPDDTYDTTIGDIISQKTNLLANKLEVMNRLDLTREDVDI
jgi:hypothetical protein